MIKRRGSIYVLDIERDGVPVGEMINSAEVQI
jgi:hypothetical protein